MDPAPAVHRHPDEAHELLWSLLRGRRLAGCAFRRRHPCGPFLLDFFCAAHRVAIQLDGDGSVHPDARRLDRRRGQFLAARGITVLRFSPTQVLAHTDAVLATVAFCLGGVVP